MRSIPRLFLVALVAACSSATPAPARGSIGAVLARDTETGAVHVREAPDGLAGASAGLVPGDRVKMIDGVLVDDLDAERVQTLLRGVVGTEVVLTVLRGDEVVHVTITRQPLGAKPTLAPQKEKQEEKIE
ncbi:MAG: PDZ domain-containing protein [Polyangiaceae bacterium]